MSREPNRSNTSKDGIVDLNEFMRAFNRFPERNVSKSNEFTEALSKFPIVGNCTQMRFPLEQAKSDALRAYLLLDELPGYTKGMPTKFTRNDVLNLIESIEDSDIHSIYNVIEAKIKSKSDLNDARSQFNESADLCLPVVAPKLWKDRIGTISPSDFIAEVYGKWIDQGLTRNVIRRLDIALYQAFCTQISRLKKAGESFPKGLESLAETQSDRVDAEIATKGLASPSDAYRLPSVDRRAAERLRGAMRRRM